MIVGGLVLLAVTAAVWGVVYLVQGKPRVEVAARESSARQVSPLGCVVGSLAVEDRGRWSQKSSVPTDGSARVGRHYELARGWVDLRLTRGAHVVIQGPAAWQLTSDQQLLLESGKLIAHVPRSARGFTVVTPSAEVVDLGTEFGVEVDGAGKTDVHVLKGSVEVKRLVSEVTAPVRSMKLGAGEAVRISADGACGIRPKLPAALFRVGQDEQTGPVGESRFGQSRCG